MLEPTEGTDPDAIDSEILELAAPWAPVAALGNPAEDALARELSAVIQHWLREQLAAGRQPVPPNPTTDRERVETSG